MDRLYILCALIFSFSASAVDIKVVFNKGTNTKISESGETVYLSKGMTIVESDTIKTTNSGFTILKIDGHSVMRIEEGSVVKVNQLPYFYQKSKELEQGAELELRIGTILIEMIEESGTESMRLKTKSATLGVRGTRFLADMNEDLLVSVDEGLVAISNNATKQADYIEPNQSMIVEKGVFTARMQYDFQKKFDWNVKSGIDGARAKRVSPFKRKTRLLNIRKLMRAEFKKRRTKWEANPARLAKFKKRWEKRKKIFRKKTKNLKPSEKRRARKQLLQKVKDKKRGKVRKLQERLKEARKKKPKRLPDLQKLQQKKPNTQNRKQMIRDRIQRVREQKQQRRRTGR